MRYALALVLLAACGGSDDFRHDLFTIRNGQISCLQGGDFEPAAEAGYDFACCFPNGATHDAYQCDRAWAYFRHSGDTAEPTDHHGVIDGWEYAVFFDGCH